MVQAWFCFICDKKETKRHYVQCSVANFKINSNYPSWFQQNALVASNFLTHESAFTKS